MTSPRVLDHLLLRGADLLLPLMHVHHQPDLSLPRFLHHHLLLLRLLVELLRVEPLRVPHLPQRRHGHLEWRASRALASARAVAEQLAAAVAEVGAASAFYVVAAVGAFDGVAAYGAGLPFVVGHERF